MSPAAPFAPRWMRPCDSRPGPDAGAHLAVDQVEVLITAARTLVQREQVHVVVDPHGRVVALFEPAADVEPVPAGHDGRRDRSAGREVDGTGDAHGDAPDRHVGRAREHLVDHRERRVERLGRAARDVPRAVRLLEDVALEHCHADVDVQRAQRADDDAAAAAAEAQGAGCSAARGGAELTVFEVADLDRLVDALRDHSSAEARDPPDHWAGRCLARAHHVDDPQKARHFIGLSAEAQCGLRGHGRFSHKVGLLPTI